MQLTTWFMAINGRGHRVSAKVTQKSRPSAHFIPDPIEGNVLWTLFQWGTRVVSYFPFILSMGNINAIFCENWKEMYLMEPKFGTSDDLSKLLRPGGEEIFIRRQTGYNEHKWDWDRTKNYSDQPSLRGSTRSKRSNLCPSPRAPPDGQAFDEENKLN